MRQRGERDMAGNFMQSAAGLGIELAETFSGYQREMRFVEGAVVGAEQFQFGQNLRYLGQVFGQNLKHYVLHRPRAKHIRLARPAFDPCRTARCPQRYGSTVRSN